MSFKTDYARARGKGAAHDGVHHFVIQRVTAIALVPLAIFFVFPFAKSLGAGYEEARAIWSNGWNALIAINFLILAFWHLKLGNQVIIEDYVPERLRVTMLLVNLAFCWTFGAIGVFAVARVAF